MVFMGHLGMNCGVMIAVLLWFFNTSTVQSIGANWGTQATHPLPPSTIVQMLRDNGIQKVKLFDAEYRVLNAFSGSGIQIMVGIPNDMLSTLASSADAADTWVRMNVSTHIPSVDIRYVAVGNEPFLAAYNGSFRDTTFPALQNIQEALIKAGLGNQVKVTVPLNADVYQSATPQPSTGDFKPDIHDLMVKIVNFLSLNGAPFTVNIYPFISLYDDPNFPLDYAFFDGYSSPIDDNGRIYTNVFDANHDTLVWALFSLIDEDAKSIQPGNFERHWGIFNYDGTPKYNLNLGSNSKVLVRASNVRYLPSRWCVWSSSANLLDSQVAPSVSYACDHGGDCTSLGYGTSCGNLTTQQNISYAFNSYYQVNNQLASACQFPNLSVITTTDPSVGTCKFKIMIRTGNQLNGGGILLTPHGLMLQFLVFLLSLV